MTFSGSCPSSFTTAALGNGGSATPTLTGAVPGSSCTVSEPAPAAAGGTWIDDRLGQRRRRNHSVGSERAARGAAFALVAGTNTVSFKNTWTGPSSTSIVPDPTTGGWQLNGSSALSGSELVLTPATTGFAAGSAFWPQPIDPRSLTVEYDASITGGSGADGLALVLGDASKGAKPTSLGVSGGGLGFSGSPASPWRSMSTRMRSIHRPTSSASRTVRSRPRPMNSTGSLPQTSRRRCRGRRTTSRLRRLRGRSSWRSMGRRCSPDRLVAGERVSRVQRGTGGSTNRHAISHLVVTSGGPAASTLQITNAVTGARGL